MKKLASDTVTMNQIKNQVRKMMAEGTRIDMIILDYIDCVVPDKMLGDEWKSEGSVMRGFEAMCHELDIAGWTATQGNRNSISSEVVTTDQMGGSSWSRYYYGSQKSTTKRNEFSNHCHHKIKDRKRWNCI